MKTLAENIATRLTEGWRTADLPRRGRTYRCSCGRPVFFRNSVCLACGSMLGYEPERVDMRALLPGTIAGTWTLAGDEAPAQAYRRCANLDSPAGCNWLLPSEHASDLCISCRLNRTIPNLADPDSGRYWRSIENAKRRLVSQLLAIGLPVKSKVEEDPESGMMFDLLRTPPGGPHILTSHGNGLITINVEEADDSIRERIRHEMHEPYRTLLGHFRHEIGHYYWDRLVAGTPWHEKFRALFGDERDDYNAALQRNYQNGPPVDWPNNHISAYASVHPWEDWAECFAHYLHLVDSLDTALGYGMSGDDIEVEIEPFQLEDLYDPEDADAKRLLSLVNSWMDLVTALNEIARSMGQHDFYPFILSRPVLKKLQFIQLVVKEARDATAAENGTTPEVHLI
ncbi:putative zinc-binding peptidase [Luteolibacter flavescens]|uniref:Zinc-binding peptidase n=1 Tax=Luteolibacter flavescens TaxID=1859460 RepID=A0ABT3FSJ6_9BACT|nr:putative zinc-binding metallopeptidase [Luteolibacter flavescens]MCW1885955.1 putative zinc-binding peptidase [Luteolibacter flavescens]